MDRILVGIVTKPQALKGEFRVKPMILNMKQFKKMNTIYIDNQSYSIEKVTLRDAFVILKVSGVDKCEDAEMLRNKEVFADVEIDQEDHFDMLGFEVSVDNKIIGKIVSIDNYGSKDIISLDTKCMLPVIDNIIVNVDTENNIVTLDKELFEQVVVYEN